MSKRNEDEKKIAKEVTNDLLRGKFATELGQKAIVKRTTIENERMDELREVLICIGNDLVKVGAVPKGMDYCGSLSVHVFKAPALNEAGFAVLSSLKGLSVDLADGALRELTNNTFVQYGQKHKKLRSGF